MRRFVFVFALVGLFGILTLATLASPATAQDFDLHPHMLVLKPEFVDGALVYKGCINLAANQPVPLHAHHERLHFGDSGVSFGGASGHAVVPAAPFPSPFGPAVPWSNCAGLAAFFGQP